MSREVIADSVETVVMQAERLDGSVLLAGCDKSLPGMLMAAARLDLASVFLYAGSTLPGKLDGRDVTIIDAFEGVGACARGLITRDELGRDREGDLPGRGRLRRHVHRQHDGLRRRGARAWRCPARPPRPPSTAAATTSPCRSGEAVVRLVEQGITARKILTKKAFENAITVVMALGGSTNAVLHLLAIAHEAEVDLTLDDFNRIGDKVPHLADVKPFGRYVMTDIDRIGGVPVVMKALLDAGLLHGDALTVTGKTVAENLAELAPPDPDGKIIHALSDPIHKTGGLTILRGSLAPEGAVVKTAGFDADVFEGTARVFDGEQGAMDAVEDGTLEAGRRRRHPLRGPQGRPRHARDARGHRRDQGRRASARTSCCSPTAGSPAARRACASATSPPRRPTAGRSRSSRTATGIRLDVANRTLDLLVDAERPRAAPGRLEAAGAALHHRRARQVRQARRLRGPGRHHRLTPACLTRPPPGCGS